jgi:Tol biopolymer transport system component
MTSPLSPATSQPEIEPTLKIIPTPLGIVPPSGLIYKMPDGLWRVEADGKATRLLSLNAVHMSFVLSPEGDRVLYWDWNEGDIWVGDLRTGETRNLTNTPARFECCPLWWAEHPGMMLFASQSSSDRPWGPVLLVAKNLSNGELQIIDQSGSFIGPAAFSPDGHSIAYSRGGHPVLYHQDEGIESFDLADFGASTTATNAVGGPACHRTDSQLLGL